MFRRKQKERLPWYRKRGYKGNLTEDEKRELDSFRLREKRDEGKHPAAKFDDIPDEVSSYIIKIEIALQDERQLGLVGRCFLISGLAAFYLANYLGWISLYHGSFELGLAVFFLVAPWVYYSWKHEKNRYEFSNEWGNEGIRTEWELEHIVSKKMRRD
jgi:hypothetical protein